MRRKLPVLLLALLAVALLARCASEPDDTIPPKMDGVSIMAEGAPAGFYEFEDYRPSNGASYAQFKTGSFDRIEMNEINPTAGVFSWGRFDNWADRTKNTFGFDIGVGFTSISWGIGTWAPNDYVWLPSDYLEAADEGVYYYKIFGSGADYHRVPRFWGAEYLAWMEDFASEAAVHFSEDPQGRLVDWVEIPFGRFGELGITVSEENVFHLAQMNTDADAGDLAHLGFAAGSICTAATGCTTNDGARIWDATIRAVIDVWVDAFTAAGATQRLVVMTANYSFEPWVRESINGYAIANGAGISHNKLLDDGDDWYSYWPNGRYGQYDGFPLMGTESFGLAEAQDSWAYGNSNPPNNPPVPNQTNLEEQLYWSVANAIANRISILKVNFEPVPGSIYSYRVPYTNTQVAEIMTEFMELGDKQDNELPFVVSYQRESQFAWRPKCGNFERGLELVMTQGSRPANQSCNLPASTLPAIAGSVTAPAYDAIPQIACAGQDLQSVPSCDPRNRYARKTTAGNPYMYFRVSDDFFYGSSLVQVYTTYADVGTASFTVGCSADSAEITKTNTGQWVTVQTELSCSLTNSLVGASDIYLRDGTSGGNLIIQKVKLEVDATYPGAPTPTPTWTPGTPPTPTAAAPTATPTAGSVWAQTVVPNNNWQDTYINSQVSDTNYGFNQYVNLSAGTLRNTPMPTYAPSTAKQGLVDVDLTFPTDVAFGFAGLSYYVNSGGPATMYVIPCQIKRAWTEAGATWNSYAAGSAWQTPGAYGANDVGTCGTPVPITSADVGSRLTFDVTNLMTYQGLNIKLQPVCTPNPSGYCNVDYYLNTQNNSTGNLPSLLVSASAAGSTPTATWTASPTATPLASSTPTPTPTNTPTLTPTPTRTPTVVPSNTPGGATSTPTATSAPTGTATATPTRTPTATATPTVVSSMPAVMLNEICPNMQGIDLFPDGTLGNDNATELLARATTDVTGWRLCGRDRCVRLNGTLDAGERLVFYQELDGVTLSNQRGEVTLFNGNTTPWTAVDTLSWQLVNPDHCLARLYDGAPTWIEQRWPTMGLGNSYWAAAPTPTLTPSP